MPHRRDKLISLILCLSLLLEQVGFAQTVSLNLSNYLSQTPKPAVSDTFRPLHLRYLSYDSQSNDFKLLLDKGDAVGNGLKPFPTPEDATQELIKYFFIGLALPNDKFWVNLRPDAPDNIIDDDLARTDIGRIFLEADVQLKKDTAQFTSPQTPEGKVYWDKLYQKAGELFGSENITIPTLTRPWIVPNEIIIREAPDNAYIYKATLKVMLEEDCLKSPSHKVAKLPANLEQYSFKDIRLQELNEYSTKLIKELIIPKLTYQVNTSKRYAPLRQVYYSLILAQWFKQKFGRQSPVTSHQSPDENNPYLKLIDSRDLTNLTSKTPYDKQDYFRQYQQSFRDGEYSLSEPVYTPMGQSIRRYMSGGGEFTKIMDSASPIIGKKMFPNIYKYCIGIAFAGVFPFLSQSVSAEEFLRIKTVSTVDMVTKDSRQENINNGFYLNKLWQKEADVPTPVDNEYRHQSINAALKWMKEILWFDGNEEMTLEKINRLAVPSYTKMYLSGLVFYALYCDGTKQAIINKRAYYALAEAYIKELILDFSIENPDRDRNISALFSNMRERNDGSPKMGRPNTIERGDVIIWLRSIIFALRVLVDKNSEKIGWKQRIEDNKDDLMRELTAYVRNDAIAANGSLHEYGGKIIKDYDIRVLLWYIAHEFAHIDSNNEVILFDGVRGFNDALGEFRSDVAGFVVVEYVLGLTGTIEMVMGLRGFEHAFEAGRKAAEKLKKHTGKDLLITMDVHELHAKARAQLWVLRMYFEEYLGVDISNGAEMLRMFRSLENGIKDTAVQYNRGDTIYLLEVVSRLFNIFLKKPPNSSVKKPDNKDDFYNPLFRPPFIPNKSGSSPMQTPSASSAVELTKTEFNNPAWLGPLYEGISIKYNNGQPLSILNIKNEGNEPIMENLQKRISSIPDFLTGSQKILFEKLDTEAYVYLTVVSPNWETSLNGYSWIENYSYKAVIAKKSILEEAISSINIKESGIEKDGILFSWEFEAKFVLSKPYIELMEIGLSPKLQGDNLGILAFEKAIKIIMEDFAGGHIQGNFANEKLIEVFRNYFKEIESSSPKDPAKRIGFGNTVVVSANIPTISGSLPSTSQNDVGGIAFNALPIRTEAVASSVLGAFSGAKAFQGDLDAEWAQIQAVFNAGIRPSVQRISEYTAAAASSGLAGERIDQVRVMLADILRRDEEDKKMSPASADLKNLVTALES